MRTVIVGIGGASCSGKSTLSEWLTRIFANSAIYHMDKHFKADSYIPVKNGIQDWDCAEAIDFDAFVADLERLPTLPVEHILNPNRPVISDSQVSPTTLQSLQSLVEKSLLNKPPTRFWFLDGFLLYCDKRVINLMDIKIALHTRYEELKRRRGLRAGYQTIEGYWPEPPGYFDNYVWPGYLKYNIPILRATGELPETKADETQEGAEEVVQEVADLEIFNTEVSSVEEVVKQSVHCIMKHLEKC
ncbi:hypothetical protein SmJEL517_g04591 [Synchytrium microbalum]|uniref:Phosphoribulokinase/uridine kinase domain-containing protein n=1 Tax=Synchytrium microbalum TaxID=1806994 RepID=A0A507BZH9_9FUNG|nr:uncharacterized protein SmJEL517_g04591 [Synchytrium microbalum]TPX32269.1 hypothetical protein SmJEL517_g04591 [Synchytrium microbalum]